MENALSLPEPIGILGYGLEGASTGRFLLERGYRDVVVFDRRPLTELDARLRPAEGSGSENYLSALNAPRGAVRTLFRSAGIRPDLPEIRAFRARGGLLSSQTELALALADRRRVIGVTGTLGKGSCCSLLLAMLAEAGIPARLGGNIGVPALELAGSLRPDEYLILELSSFQLSSVSASPGVAIVLRTTSEHLDWHLSRDEYWEHKSHLVAGQSEGDLLVYCADAPGSAWIAGRGGARTIAYGGGAPVRIEGGAVHWTERGLTLPLAATRLKGTFNLENIAAAGTVAMELGVQPAQVSAAARSFRGLEHRLEFVRAVGGLSYYDDSYATRPEAVLGAIDALSGAPLGLILGGSEKHADFSELAAGIARAQHIKALALIGQTAGRLEDALTAARAERGLASYNPSGEAPPPLLVCSGLEEALRFLTSSLKTGAVALSPACASFGMFENYQERGKAFKRLVEKL